MTQLKHQRKPKHQFIERIRGGETSVYRRRRKEGGTRTTYLRRSRFEIASPQIRQTHFDVKPSEAGATFCGPETSLEEEEEVPESASSKPSLATTRFQPARSRSTMATSSPRPYLDMSKHINMYNLS